MLARRLTRFAGFAALMALFAAAIAAHNAPTLPTDLITRLRLPGGLTLHELLAALAALLGAVAAFGAAGRLLGRRLRHPQPVGRRWPLRAALSRLQDQLVATSVELVLARDALAEPYEVAKLADGLLPILRTQRRLVPAALLGPDTLILEQRTAGGQSTVAFVLTTSARALPAVLARVRATYPGTHTQPAEPAAALADPKAGVVRLKKRRPWVWSLQTTKDYTHSSVSSLVAALHAAPAPTVVQLVLTPAPAWVQRRAGRLVRRRERHLRAETGTGVEPGIESVTAQKDLKGALEGVGRAYYWFDWRILTAPGPPAAAAGVIGALAELRQDNELRPRTIRARRRLTIHRARLGLAPLVPSWWTGALSAAEIASCWHLPSARTRTPGLRRQAARQIPAPAAISRDPADMLLVDDRGPLGIAPADRRKGLAVLGAPGAGKSSLLLRAIGNAARDPDRAVLVVDLKEDLARDALAVIPTRRRVHVIDLAHPHAGINPLAVATLAPEVRADILIAAIREAHGDDSVGPRSDSLLRAAITAVCIAEQTPTLTHVLAMLDAFQVGYRQWATRELSFHPQTDFLRSFWESEFPALVAANPRFVSEAVAAPRNKLQRFLAVPSLTLATNHPVAVDLERAIADRDIVVVNGSKAAVGEDNAILFCQLVILLVQRALHQRQHLHRDQRTPATLVVDEAHNVFTRSFASMLSEGRAAGLEAVAAFQYTAQIRDETVRAAVKSLLQNVSITRMRDLDDARALAGLAMDLYADAIRIDPDEQRKLTLDPADITRAPDHQALNLWLTDGVPQPAFTARTIPVEPVVDTSAGRRRRASHERAQADRGWHPHDHGQPIRPPLVWDAGNPVAARDRTIHVDLTAWPGRPDLTKAEVAIVLTADGHHAHYPAEPTDTSGRRYRTIVPTAPTAAGWLPAGTYTAAIVVTGPDGEEAAWQPTVDVLVDARRRIARQDPATVELTDPPRYTP